MQFSFGNPLRARIIGQLTNGLEAKKAKIGQAPRFGLMSNLECAGMLDTLQTSVYDAVPVVASRISIRSTPHFGCKCGAVCRSAQGNSRRASLNSSLRIP